MSSERRPEIEQLYREAVAVADRARTWFDGPGVAWRATLPVDGQALVATHSLAVTARLMASMAWLLDPALAIDGAALPHFRIADDAATASPALFAGTPGEAVIAASLAIATRIAALAGDNR